MADTGYKYPTNNGLVYSNWSFANNAYSSNNDWTSGEPDKSEQHDWYEFALGVPAGVTINGIEVRLEGCIDETGNTTVKAALSYNGGTNWTGEKSDTFTSVTPTDEFVTYGGAADTWGRAWTVAEFSDANFIVYLLTDASSPVENDINIDGIQVKVFYSYGSPSLSPSASVSPSVSPSISPSPSPSVSPSISPSESPSVSPSESPSLSPSTSMSPSVSPSASLSPSTSPSASESPSLSPSMSPSASASPSLSPSSSLSPSASASVSPSASPSVSPSLSPSVSPSISPSPSPSMSPSASMSSSVSPSASPSPSASLSPSVSPSPSAPLYTAYVLDGHSLPRPKFFRREFVSIAQDVRTIDGKEGRDRSHLKERYILGWDTLNAFNVSRILSVVDKSVAVSFSISEDNLTILSTDVLVKLNSINYITPGEDYRAELEIELLEVD